MKALVLAGARALPRDYLELTKPRLSAFALVVVGLSAWLALPGGVGWPLLLNAVLGAGLVAGGASALNMLLERDADARMARTANRPLPSGRLQPRDVFLFGVAMTGAGLLLLLLTTTPLAALLAALTSVTYLGLYTPLKRVTTLNTHVGAVPGALPALLGWAAVRGTLDPAAWTLFLLVYLWQIPHFLSIAWLYREDYARGGFRMLPSVDREGLVTGRQAVLGTLALLAASLLPPLTGLGGGAYRVGAVALGAWFLLRAVSFGLDRTPRRARLLMRASLLYLPLLLGLLVADPVS